MPSTFLSILFLCPYPFLSPKTELSASLLPLYYMLHSLQREGKAVQAELHVAAKRTRQTADWEAFLKVFE